MFSKGVVEEKRHEVQHVLQIDFVDQHNKHLGLPTMIGKSKRSIFAFLLDRVGKKMSLWKEKLLSKAGKMVLIKAVVQAMPLYVMSCFILPMSVCKDIERMAARFWWSSGKKDRGMHWSTWNKLCTKKKEGGLGFRSLQCFNLAMMAKQAWKIITAPDSLLARVFKSKYFPTCELMEAPSGRASSFVWQGLKKAKEVLNHGLRWRVGDGKRIQIWKSKWLACAPGFMVRSPVSILNENAFVSELIDGPTGSWKEDLIDAIFSQSEAAEIKRIPLSARRPADIQLWHHTTDGNYSVKTGYIFAWRNLNPAAEEPNIGSGSCQKLWVQVWEIIVMPKINLFGWRAMQRYLPSNWRLIEKGMIRDPACSRCDCNIETTIHALKDCPWAQQVWWGCKLTLRVNGIPASSFRDWFEWAHQHLNTADLALFLVLNWAIWNERNRREHDKGAIDTRIVIATAERIHLEYLSHQVRQCLTLPTTDPNLVLPAGTILIRTDVYINGRVKSISLVFMFGPLLKYLCGRE